MLIKTSEERYPIEISGGRKIPSEEVLRAVLSGEDPKYADFRRRLLEALGKQARAVRKYFLGVPGGNPDRAVDLALNDALKGAASGKRNGLFRYSDAAGMDELGRVIGENYARSQGIPYDSSWRNRGASGFGKKEGPGFGSGPEAPGKGGWRLPKNWKTYAAGGGLAGLGALGAYLLNKEWD